MNYGELREMVLAHLESTPKGATWTDIRGDLDVLSNGCSVASRLCVAGLVGYVDEPVTGLRGRSFLRRYYARKHCPPEAVLLPLSKKAAPVQHVQKNITTNRPRRVLSPTGDAIVPEGVKVTVWQAPPDPRRVVQVTPFFSVGKRVQADTPIQRYYGAPGSRWGEL
jgi:hypothetical protein